MGEDGRARPATDGRPAATAAATRPAEPYDWAEAKKFWSFQPVKEVAPPAPGGRRPTGPGVATRSTASSPPATSRATSSRCPTPTSGTLIRRATYDLTGLPPTPEEVEAFEADTSPDAFAKVVDRLLASPAYGEAWGRHWLDVVRYADTSGDNSDYPTPQAYHYRDYVIRSFNEDKPYDQFLREQLAGDLLPAKDDAERRDHAVATGYLAIARRFGSRNADIHLTIDDTIDNVGKSMLGLSVSCARCHDHKFDPIPNADYYALYGIFASTKYSFPGTEIYRHAKDYIALGGAEEAAQLHDYEEKLAELDDRVENLTREKRWSRPG